MFLTGLVNTPPMLRYLSRSTLYSSSCPSSINATRRSSFSTLMNNFVAVWRRDRRNRFTVLSSSYETFLKFADNPELAHGLNQEAERQGACLVVGAAAVNAGKMRSKKFFDAGRWGRDGKARVRAWASHIFDLRARRPPVRLRASPGLAQVGVLGPCELFGFLLPALPGTGSEALNFTADHRECILLCAGATPRQMSGPNWPSSHPRVR